MNFLWFDYESSGSRVNFDHVLEASFVLTDNRLKILEKTELKCRLKPNVIPNIGALLVNSISVETLQKAPLSHYQLVLENHKWFEKFTPSYFTGYNITGFDIEFYRRMLFKNLIPNWYQTNTNGNKIYDVLPHIRVAKLVNRNVIATKLNQKGNDSFKLADIAEVGNFNHGISHTSLVDCLNTIEVAKKIKQGAPEIWDSSLQTAHKTDAEKVIDKEKVICTFEYFYSKARPFCSKFLFYHPVYRWATLWDLKQHPKDFINLDRQELAKALTKSPKAIRTCKHNKNPLIMKKEFALAFEPYSEIGMNELMERAKILDDNTSFVKTINSILENNAKEKIESNQIEPLFEESLYSGGLNVSSSDKTNMNKFHEVDLKGKLNLIEKFNDERFAYFAKCILYEEFSQKELPDSLYKEMHMYFAERLNSKNGDEKWETFGSFYKQVDDIREKYKDDENKLNLLNGYDNYVQEMEKKFENV